MAKLNLMSWGKDDNRNLGLRGRIGKWLLKQSLRLIPVESHLSFYWRPDGYSNSNEENDKHYVVISEKPVKYWEESSDRTHVYAVKNEFDDILGLFWTYPDAMNAASLLSQHYNDYHFSEDALNVDENRVQVVEDRIEEIEPNLEVERVPLFSDFNSNEWPTEAHLINGDTVRTFEEVRKSEGLETSENSVENT